MIGTEAYELEPLEDVDEQELFLSILYHDARGGNAIRMLLGEEESGNTHIRHYANKDYKKLDYRSSAYNCYASLNTFKSFRRISDDVYNFSGIFIDLDGHEYTSTVSMDKAIEKTKKRLRTAFENKEISEPTMITYTGRGLGIFYILSSSIANSEKSKKSVWYLDQVRAALTAKYKKLLEGTGYLDVDSTVKDYARVCRVPLTMNKKINRWCRLVHVNYTDEGYVRYYDLKQLASDNYLFDEINEIRKQLKARRVVSLDAYRLPFLTIRLQKLEILQELRQFVCTGSREYMIFIYYNAAKQVYGEREAISMTKMFNARFVEPLADPELEHVFKVVNENIAPAGNYEGFYKLPDKWIVETLEVTEEENSVCCFGASKRQIERQNIKEANIQRREERNKKIAEFIVANPDKTYPEIAIYFGVSESLVYRVCKQYEIHRHKADDARKRNPEESVQKKASSKSLHNLSQSLLGVPSGVDAGMDFMEPESTDVRKEDGLIQAYADLYGEVTKRRRENRPMHGQYVLKSTLGGGIEYYMIS